MRNMRADDCGDNADELNSIADRSIIERYKRMRIDSAYRFK